MNSRETVSRTLANCGAPDAVLPPTMLFNKGWMLRLVLDWASRHPLSIPEPDSTTTVDGRYPDAEP
jgi:hypothetical protein